MATKVRGLRKIILARAVFDLVAAQAGGVAPELLGPHLAKHTGIPDLSLSGVIFDGPRVVTWVESETFPERERCQCRALELPLTIPRLN